jgi:hypothetical protein
LKIPGDQQSIIRDTSRLLFDAYELVRETGKSQSIFNYAVSLLRAMVAAPLPGFDKVIMIRSEEYE